LRAAILQEAPPASASGARACKFLLHTPY